MNRHPDSTRKYFTPNGMLETYITNVCEMRHGNAPNSKADYFRHTDDVPPRSSMFVYKGRQYSKIQGGKTFYNQEGTGPLRGVFDGSYTM